MPLTKQDIQKIENLMEGVMKNLATKEDLYQFATKEDMKTLATKNDLAEAVDHLARLTGEHFMRLEYRMESVESALPLVRRPARS
jgi:hypothetical protein